MHTEAAIILAGGLARRMGGGDKGLRTIGGIALLERVIATLRPQVAILALNANGDPARFAPCGLPVVSDSVPGHPGPLAGVLAGLEWLAAHHPAQRWLVSVPSDTPFLPDDLVRRLSAAVTAEQADLACVRSGGQMHPVVGLWPVRLTDALRQALVTEDIRRIRAWTSRYRCAVVDYPDTPVDPFFNANSPEDLAQAEHWLGESSMFWPR